MPKQSGLGQALYLAGVDVSGDIGSIDQASGGPALLDVTAIDKSAYERIGGLRDGQINYTAFFNPDPNRAHAALSTLPTADALVSWLTGTALGDPAACLLGKQINYDPTRGNDGQLTFKVQALANAFGLEWGRQLTAGKRTDTTATNGTAWDYSAAQPSPLGLQAYLHVFAFTGTSVTVKLQDSADNVSFADIAGAGFTAATGVTSQRIAATAVTVRRYVRAVTTGTFSNAVFAVTAVRNDVAVSF